MGKRSGTGFFKPRSMEDIAQQLEPRGSTSGITKSPDTTHSHRGNMLNLLDLQSAPHSSNSMPNTSTICSYQTPFVSSATAGNSPCVSTPAAALGPLSTVCQWTNSLLLNQLLPQAQAIAVPAQKEARPTGAVPICGSASQQARPAAVQADAYTTPSCSLDDSLLWGLGDVGAVGGVSVNFSADGPTLPLWGAHTSTSTSSSSSSSSSSTSSSTVMNGLLFQGQGPTLDAAQPGSCPGPAVTSSYTPAALPARCSSSSGQHVVGSGSALAAAALAQEKLAQLAQLDAMRQQLRQDCVDLLPLI